MSLRRLIVVLLTLIAVAGWYWFRPELLFVNATVDEAVPVADAAADKVLAEGTFHSVAHETKGNAAVHLLADGRRVLRLSGFATSNGPAVFVYLIDAADADDHATVKQAQFVNLGALKGNIGDQNYELPAYVNLNKYRAVTIWCRRFGVNFATAPFKTKS